MIAFDLNVMKETFFRRYAKYQGNQIDNSSLPAGSPMYYYCKGCALLITTLPEGWYGESPAPLCASCKILNDHGLLDELTEEAQRVVADDPK